MAGAIILGIEPVVPVAMLPLWPRPGWRPVLLAVYWLVAVGYFMHALIEQAERVLSLVRRVQIHCLASVWRSVDRRAADLQDLFVNAPRFLVEGSAYSAGSAWILCCAV